MAGAVRPPSVRLDANDDAPYERAMLAALDAKKPLPVRAVGGKSASLMIDVIGVGILEPKAVLEKMPFMTVECALEDGLLCDDVPEKGAADDVPTTSMSDTAAALAEAAADAAWPYRNETLFTP